MTGGRQVALLRGINVGRAKRVPMAELRAAVEGLGFGEVRTLLNSGNVVFRGTGGEDADAAAERIGAAVLARTGVRSRVTVLHADELATAVAENPVADRDFDPARLLVAFARHPDDLRPLAPLLAADWSPDVLAVGTRAAYLLCTDGILGSRLPDAVARALGDAVTTRNWSTVLRLHALAAG